MGRISAEEKLIAVKRRLEGGESFEAIENSMGVHHERIREWCRKYQSMGSDAFVRTKNNKYTLEFKITAVEYYLQGKGSLYDTCRTFNIPAQENLRRWIKRYNSHELGSLLQTQSTKVIS